MFALPYSKNKRYLSGIDWMICALDYMTNRKTGVGNLSQIVLELDGMISESTLKSALDEFLKSNPIINGYIKRDWNLAPFWKIPKNNIENCLLFKSISLSNDADLDNIFLILTDELNKPFINKRHHLSFCLIYWKNKSYLGMKFDHKLLDARGAEAFLNKFNSEFIENKFVRSKHTYSAKLNLWKQKFDSGKFVNRMFSSLRDDNPPAVLEMPKKNNSKTKVVIRSYDQITSKKIIENANKKAGYLMIMPFLLANATKSFNRLFKTKKIETNNYIIPINLDTRLSGALKNQLFFNFVSFLYFKISTDVCENFEKLSEIIKFQFYEQVSKKTPFHFSQSALLLRICPLWLVSKLIKIPFRGQLASFSFSYVANSGYESENFMGLKVLNILHMPRVPTPPGIGLFFTSFKGRLNVVFSFLKSMVNDEEIQNFISSVELGLIDE